MMPGASRHADLEGVRAPHYHESRIMSDRHRTPTSRARRRHPAGGGRSRAPALHGRLAPPGPGAAAELARAVAAVTAGRLRRAERSLETLARQRGRGGRSGKVLATTLAALVAQGRVVLASLPARARQDALCGPDLRGFLSEAEIWIDVLRLTAPSGPEVVTLFERISRTEHLVTLVPAGRMDAAFPARARAFALDRLDALVSDLGALLLGLRLATATPSPRALSVTLGFRASAEQGRPADRIDLGSFAGPAGALGLRADVVPGGRAGAARRGHPGLRARIERGLLTVRPPGRPPILIPAAGSPLASSHPLLASRRLIPGSAILLAPALRAGRRRMGVGRELPGLAPRLARALRLVRLAWPEAYRDLAKRTAMVVPVREPGLVSYSLAARPGISFINVHGKRTVELADDLLHENSHHLLHDVQETVRLLAPGPATEEVQAFASPWRGTLRPLHGILHGTFTFLFRAELFARILAAHARRPRVMAPLIGPGGAVFVRRELRRELAMLERGLADLGTAGAHRLLTPAGRELAAALLAWHRRLRRPGAARPPARDRRRGRTALSL